MKKRVTFDFETRSCVDLKKAGGYKYSLDPSTRPTCLAFKIMGQKSVYFLPFETIEKPWKKLPLNLRSLWSKLIEDGYEFSAHNAFFETCIYKNILVRRLGWPDIPFRNFRCTAAKAASCALPRSLDGAGMALGLKTQKDRQGYFAMMATCKPTKEWTTWQKKVYVGTSSYVNEPKKFIDPLTHPDIFKTLYHYCKIDVLAEEELDLSLPDLIPIEQEIWFLNQKLNWRGLKIDIPTVKKIVEMLTVETKKKTKELDNITMGLVTKPGARNSILEFLALEGIELPNLQAQTVTDTLEGNKLLSNNMKRLLQIRQALSKTSTKKYQAFLDRGNDDQKVRDILMYHGASTGRDTGTGVQPHNFPRGIIAVEKARPYAAVNDVTECNHELLQVLYGESLSMLFSSILRNMIMPENDKELFVADFAKIEVAVLWWLSNNTPGLEILHSGKDPYIYMAAANRGKKYEEIAEEGRDRQLGKAQVLGCGFGMGWSKFKETAWMQYRLQLTDEQSKAAVTNYREANEAVPELWKNYELAALAAVEQPGKCFEVGKCKFFLRNKFLWVELPSKRRLAYYNPSITWRVREYEVKEVKKDKSGKSIEVTRIIKTQPQKTLVFWAVNSKTKKWGIEHTWGGTLTENIVQAVARDLMMQASLRLDKNGYEFLLSVHDEGLTQKTLGKGSLEEFTKLMCTRPHWVDDKLPLDAKAWKGERYRK